MMELARSKEKSAGFHRFYKKLRRSLIY
jgi:hypothetical protein